MLVETNVSVPRFFTRKGLIKSPESLPHARIIRRDVFEKQSNDAAVAIRFVVTWLRTANGHVVPTVARADLPPLLEEVLNAREALNA